MEIWEIIALTGIPVAFVLGFITAITLIAWTAHDADRDDRQWMRREAPFD